MKKESILSYIVLLFSLANIFNHRDQLISLSVGLSLIGIAGFIAFKRKNNLYKSLFLIWIIAQFPIIEVYEIKNGIKHVNKLFDLSQAFRVKFGFGLNFIPNTYNVSLNFIPFLLFSLYRFLMTKSLVTSTVNIMPLSGQSPLAEYTPLEAIIIDLQSGYIVAELKEVIKIEGIDYQKVLFQTADKSVFKLQKPRQKCSIKLIPITHEVEFKTEGFIN